MAIVILLFSSDQSKEEREGPPPTMKHSVFMFGLLDGGRYLVLLFATNDRGELFGCVVEVVWLHQHITHVDVIQEIGVYVFEDENASCSFQLNVG